MSDGEQKKEDSTIRRFTIKKEVCIKPDGYGAHNQIPMYGLTGASQAGPALQNNAAWLDSIHKQHFKVP